MKKIFFCSNKTEEKADINNFIVVCSNKDEIENLLFNLSDRKKLTTSLNYNIREIGLSNLKKNEIIIIDYGL